MSNPILPPVPYNSPITDRTGKITFEWSNWFRSLWIRAGGADAPSNSQIAVAKSQIDSLNPTLASLQANVDTLQSEIDGLSQGRQL